MKTISMLLALCVGISCGAFAADREAKGKLLHVVSFKFKDSANKEQIKQVEDAFRGLKNKIKEIKDFKWGTNVSPEKHDKGLRTGSFLRLTATRIVTPTSCTRITRRLASFWDQYLLTCS